MKTEAGGDPIVRISRASVFAYFYFLVGCLFVVENALTALVSGMTVVTAGGIVLGSCGILAGVLSYLRHQNHENGIEPASTSLLVLSAVATGAFLFAVLSLL